MGLVIGNAYHIGTRGSQQDSFCISDVFDEQLRERKGVLGVVADGMGGLADGGEISAIITRTMLRYFNETTSAGRPDLELLYMLSLVNDGVNSYLKGRGKGGSTLAAIIIHDTHIYWMAVGDSRIYLIRGGAVIQLNREHIFAVELDERAAIGDITWEAALGDPKRAALTSYIGMGESGKVDRCIRPTRLLPGDRVLLMSDGIFSALTDEEIIWAMQFEPQAAAIKLQDMVLMKQNPYQDNMTAVIFMVTE